MLYILLNVIEYRILPITKVDGSLISLNVGKSVLFIIVLVRICC